MEQIYQPTTKAELKQLVDDNNVYLGEIDVSLIADMSRLFYESERKLFSGIETWDVSNVENMSNMFKGAENFNGDLSCWDVSSVENMESMFLGAENFNSDISGWNVTNVRDMRFMFCGAKNFRCDISKWDMSKVENEGFMFYNTIRIS